MLNYNDVKNYCSNYKIENGSLIDKTTNSLVVDEDIILKVKTSILMFKEAKESYQSAIQQFGKTSLSQEDYIKKTLEKFGVNNEVNNYGPNKLVNAILSSNGHYEENMSGNDLTNSKFSMLVPPKNEYGLALLKLKFRERCLDIEDLRISQDLSELQHNGVSKVIIDFKIKKYEKTKETTVEQQKENIILSSIQHPKAKELNELEKMKKIAKQNNDKDAYNYAQANIVNTIQNNRLTIVPEQWDSMSIEDRIAIVNIKMKESKILNEQDEFNYWNANLKSLIESKSKTEEVIEGHQPQYNSAPTTPQEPQTDYQELMNELEQEKDYKYYYNEMVKAVKRCDSSSSLTEEEKKQLIGEIFYNEGYLIDRINTEEEFKDIMNQSVMQLDGNDMEVKLQNIILSEMSEKYKKLYPKQDTRVESNVQENKSNNQEEELDLSGFVTQLKNELNNVQKAYQEMMSDGYIDDEELATLMALVERVINDGYSCKSMATRQKDIRTISIIINTLEEQQKKMKKMQNGIEEIGRSMR